MVEEAKPTETVTSAIIVGWVIVAAVVAAAVAMVAATVSMGGDLNNRSDHCGSNGFDGGGVGGGGGNGKNHCGGG